MVNDTIDRYKDYNKVSARGLDINRVLDEEKIVDVIATFIERANRSGYLRSFKLRLELVDNKGEVLP